MFVAWLRVKVSSALFCVALSNALIAILFWCCFWFPGVGGLIFGCDSCGALGGREAGASCDVILLRFPIG